MISNIKEYLLRFKQNKIKQRQREKQRKHNARLKKYKELQQMQSNDELRRRIEFQNNLIEWHQEFINSHREVKQAFSIRIYGNPLIEDEPQERDLYLTRSELEWAEENDPNETGRINWIKFNELVNRVRDEIQDNGK